MIWALHRCRAKNDSREAICAATRPYAPYKHTSDRANSWDIKPKMRLLGPNISCNGNPSEDVKASLDIVRGAFFRNARVLKNPHIQLRKRVAILDSIATGVIRSRAAAWPPGQQMYSDISKEQSKLMAWMGNLRLGASETGRQYGARKANFLQTNRQTNWAQIAAQSCIAWLAHMQRHQGGWAYKAFKDQGFEWLLEQRQQNSEGRMFHNTRTNTRNDRGKVYRWDSGWADKLALNGSHDAAVHAAKALEMLNLVGFTVSRADKERVNPA